MSLIHSFTIIGIGFILMGLLMIKFNHQIAILFFKIGKYVSKNTPFDSLNVSESWKSLARQSYGGKTAPKRCRMLGIVNVIQGFIFLSIGIGIYICQ